MPHDLILRDYQEQAVEAIKRELETVSSTLLVAAVGAGKTIMQAAFISDTIDQYPDTRFVCCVHTRELVSQNYQALIKAWPFAPAGINSAALGRRDSISQILFCSIQSVYKNAARIGWTDCLIVDESHLISPNGATMYRQFIDDLRGINPDLRILGMSGTPFRMDSGSLTEGDTALFETVAYEVGIAELIARGYLTRPISKGTATTFDVTGVHTRGGEYIAGELERAVNKREVTEAAVSEVVSFGEGRKSWLAFCAGVDHAQEVRDAFRRRGVSCEMVEGGMPPAERRRIIESYKRGEIRCLTNVNVLSIGFDYPAIDLIALMRPTKSPALYIQQCGRGLRLAPGKETVLILDFANVVRTLGPIDDVVIKEPGKGTGEAPCRLCPKCDAINHASASVCAECGFEFPESEKPKHAATADNVRILSTDEPVWEPVLGRTLAYHDKPGGTPSVKVTYEVEGGKRSSEWVCPEHHLHPKGGYAKSRADRWWHKHGGKTPFPKTVDEFLDRAGELLITTHAVLRKEGRYWNVADTMVGDTMDESYVRPPKREGNLVSDRWKAPADWDDTVPF